MTEDRLRRVNEIGLGMNGGAGELLKDIRIYPEGGSVQLWVEVHERGFTGNTHEVLQYLTPQQAMAFSAAFRRCAVQALEELTE